MTDSYVIGIIVIVLLLMGPVAAVLFALMRFAMFFHLAIWDQRQRRRRRLQRRRARRDS